MASKLCCIAEEDSGSDSPQLPNVRVGEATLAKAPLLPKITGSPNSHFTSTRTEELHELQQIFKNASDNDDNRPSPSKVRRTRFNRPSIYSLHSLHKMKSMHSIIRRKFSRNLSKKLSDNHIKLSGAERIAAAAALDTVVKQPKTGPNLQLKLTKDDLRKDLLSARNPAEGGYDDDAEVLDDIAKNMGKKSPKRPSLHSIDWTPSTGSKPTPGSSSKSRRSSRMLNNVEPYQIPQAQSVLLSARFGQVFSSPDLRADASIPRERKLRHSHSVSSIILPSPLPLSSVRLPSLKGSDAEGVPWSVALNESLGLSQFPLSPQPSTSLGSTPSLKTPVGSMIAETNPSTNGLGQAIRPPRAKGEHPAAPATKVEIRVQEPTAVATPRPSGTFQENIGPVTQEPDHEEQERDEETNPRSSVHLYSMRISHHLRSGSLLSWDKLADAPELPTPPHDRSVSDLSQLSHVQKQVSRHERQTSSSGFASSKVPGKWGRVVPQDVFEDKSSIYSSRPQSPPESLSGSMVNTSQHVIRHIASSRSSADLARHTSRRSTSCPTNIKEPPRSALTHRLTNLRDATSYSALSQPLEGVSRLGRQNSVESTKRSKFREEFSPTPLKKRLPTSASILRFLNPKRSSGRSQSEGIIGQSTQPAVDGSLEAPSAATHRERRLSRSVVSLETGQGAFGKGKQASPMWDRALKSHQDERAALFLPQNKELAAHSSLNRERSGSATRPRTSADEGVLPRMSSVKHHSAPLLEPPAASDLGSSEAQTQSTRRAALFSNDAEDLTGSHEVQMRFNQQTDTVETVGVWGRYPSHTRPDRTCSAGHVDFVETRDFALEAAVKFATGKATAIDDDTVDPATRPASPPLLSGQKKRKRRVGHARIAKSNSMTFGKAFLKNYTKIFRSQSIEFSKHGYGHRSSITSGGTLEYPELEILPDVWRRDVIEERSGEHSNEQHAARGGFVPGDNKGQAKVEEEHSTSTLRVADIPGPRRGSVIPTFDGNTDQAENTARVWSAYYEDCLPSYPRASTEMEFGAEHFGTPTRHSLDNKRTSMHSRTVPGRFSKHSRNASRVSHFSVASNGSARPSFRSLAEDDGIDERSIVSVRKSTMDLITLYKKQEVAERERVLKFTRTESRKEN